MIRAYINYPNPHITIHADTSCGNVHQQHKQNQRVISIDQASLTSELKHFSDKDYRFGSQAEINDMWLIIDLEDDTFERAVVEHILKFLSKHYSPFERVAVDEHCRK